MKRAAFLLPACLLVSLSGCAYVVNGSTETVQLDPENGAARLDKVQCKLDNKSGAWALTAPGYVKVHRGSEPLDVNCTKDGFQPASEMVKASTSLAVFGNIILGGGIGATVDTVSGAAWTYPSAIDVAMVPVAPPHTATAPAATAPAAPAPAAPAAP